MPNHEAISLVRIAIEWAALGIELLGALVIITGVIQVVITHGTIRFIFKKEDPGVYEDYKHQLGRHFYWD